MLPTTELAAWDALLAPYEPRDPVARVAWLFVPTPRYPDGDGPFHESKRAERRGKEDRREAVSALLASSFDDILRLLRQCALPWLVFDASGEAMLSDEFRDLLARSLDFDDPGDAEIVRTWLYRRAMQPSREGSERGLTQATAEWRDTVKHARGTAALVSAARCVPFDPKVWSALFADDEELRDALWRRVGRRDLRVRVEHVPEAVELLVAVHRSDLALWLLCRSAWASDGLLVPADTVIRVLNDALAQPIEADAEPIFGDTETDHGLAELLDRLADAGTPTADLARFEYAYFPVLQHRRHPTAYMRMIAAEPTWFVDLVTTVEGDGGEHPVSPEVFKRAWSLLDTWVSTPPSPEHALSDPEALRGWLDAVVEDPRCDEHVMWRLGEWLGRHGDTEADVWPPESVCAFIEEHAGREPRLLDGFAAGVSARRGVTSRAMGEGGDQERELNRFFAELASRTRLRGWARAAAALDGVADGYAQDAEREDQHAEKLRHRFT